MKSPVGELRLQNLLSYAKIIQFMYRLAAIELNRKSQMISEAVEEVLNLVQDATQKFKSMMSMDSEDLGPSKPCYSNSILFFSPKLLNAIYVLMEFNVRNIR